ncbi:MAG: STAS domain-containing protein [Prevotella sp.]|nr:STAS domain-containing protein [Prevotella sp.]
MKTTIEELNGKIVATLVGELDTPTAIEVEKELQPLFECEGRDIVIDCTALDYIASSGLRLLLRVLKHAKANNNQVALKNVNEDIREVFRLTGFSDVFTMIAE